MKKIVTAAAFAAAVMATPAFAQDSAAEPTWSGPRAEATVGWDRVVLNVDGDSGGQSGVTYGGELGYDVQVGTGAIVGVYAGVDGASTKQCLVAGTERACVRAGRNLTVGARIGAPIGSRALIYAKGGYSNGRLSVDYTDSAFPADNFRDSGDADGFHVGAGVEVGFGRGFYGKAEYNYTRYSTDDDGSVDVRFDRHRVVGGIGYRF